jgi:hypothetical protein
MEAAEGKGTISNSTIAGNHADEGGGGIHESLDTLTVRNSTLSGNTAGGAPYGGDIYGYEGTVKMLASIVANGGTKGDCALQSVNLSDQGYNIDDDKTCGFTRRSQSDSATLDRTLGPLADNGGPTPTIALLSVVQPSTRCPKPTVRLRINVESRGTHLATLAHTTPAAMP